MHNAKNISQRNILRIKACSLSWTVKKWPGLFNQTTARPSNRWLEWHDETSLIAESQKPATDRRIMHKNTAMVRGTYR
jgi:hypothetical protein